MQLAIFLSFKVLGQKGGGVKNILKPLPLQGMDHTNYSVLMDALIWDDIHTVL